MSKHAFYWGWHSYLVSEEKAWYWGTILEGALAVQIFLPFHGVLEGQSLRQVKHHDTGMGVFVVNSCHWSEPFLPFTIRRWWVTLLLFMNRRHSNFALTCHFYIVLYKTNLIFVGQRPHTTVVIFSILYISHKLKPHYSKLDPNLILIL